MSTISLTNARDYASRGLYWLAQATGTSSGDKANLLDYAAHLPSEMGGNGGNLAKGLIVALTYQQAAGENKADAEVAVLWCAACWTVWQKPGSVNSLELGQPPPPPPG